MSDKIPAGTYKGRGVEGSAQLGKASTGSEQVAIDLEIPQIGRVVTTFLFFTDAAYPYSLDRLRALGWDGSDDPRFIGISRNEVDIAIRYEPNPQKNGELVMKVEIVTGGGRVVLKEKMDERETRGFMARLADTAKRGSSPTAPAPSNSNATPSVASQPPPARKMAL